MGVLSTLMIITGIILMLLAISILVGTAMSIGDSKYDEMTKEGGE